MLYGFAMVLLLAGLATFGYTLGYSQYPELSGLVSLVLVVAGALVAYKDSKIRGW